MANILTGILDYEKVPLLQETKCSQSVGRQIRGTQGTET